eukprot:5630758-Lingulodinium_polyedra.AAC.1
MSSSSSVASSPSAKKGRLITTKKITSASDAMASKGRQVYEDALLEELIVALKEDKDLRWT